MTATLRMSPTDHIRPCCRRHVVIADLTGPLEALTDRRVLVMADVQNIDCGARDLGYRPSYGALATEINSAASSASLHAVFARQNGDERRRQYFQRRGWIPHAKTTRHVRKWGNKRPDANADHLLAFLTGLLVDFVDAELVLLATGDGQLVLDVAEAISQLPRPKPVATLSLAGSTSFRIDARRCPLVKFNLELGKDCLRPLGHRNPLRQPRELRDQHAGAYRGRRALTGQGETLSTALCGRAVQTKGD